MGAEPSDGLTQPVPGESGGARGGINPGKVVRDLLDALTQPGSPDTFLADETPGVSIVGHVDAGGLASIESDPDPAGGDTEEPGIPDGGREIDPETDSTTLFRLSDATTATEMAMDDTERLVGTVDGREATGFFGFTGTLRIDDAA